MTTIPSSSPANKEKEQEKKKTWIGKQVCFPLHHNSLVIAMDFNILKS
jgi:hypothetical protein